MQSKIGLIATFMGKCYLRFRKPEDVPLDLLGQHAEKLTPQQWIEIYERNKPKK
ncbi:MAG: hypothetical protein R3C18_04735 [Planctomycetaceae bacterium]